MNPLTALEGTTMISTSSFRTLFRHSSRRRPQHPEAIPARELDLPVLIDDPASSARVAIDLCRGRREEMTLALFLDDRHRLVGHVVLASSWVQAARLSARPILAVAGSSRATGLVLIRYRHHGDCEATLAERRSAGAIGVACLRSGITVVDHLVVVSTGAFDSVYRLRA
jgi:DNA repair protein RadC